MRSRIVILKPGMPIFGKGGNVPDGGLGEAGGGLRRRLASPKRTRLRRDRRFRKEGSVKRITRSLLPDVWFDICWVARRSGWLMPFLWFRRRHAPGRSTRARPG